LRKESLWTVVVLVVVVAGGALWFTTRSSGKTDPAASATPTGAVSSAPGAAATTAPGRAPATPTPIPGLSVSKITAAWVARWKTPPTAIPHQRPNSDQVAMHVRYPGDSAAELLLSVTRSPQAPDNAWAISCGSTSTRGKATAKPVPELLDYCLKGALGTTQYNEVLAWVKSVTHPGTQMIRHQFGGFTGAMRIFPDAGASLYLDGGTFTI
jgi:hypothetical protein